jgi:hypothetical protein
MSWFKKIHLGINHSMIFIFLVNIYSYSYGQTSVSMGLLYEALPKNNQCKYTEIHDLVIDRLNYVYIATNAGIYYYNGSEIVPYTFENTTYDNEYIESVSFNNVMYFLPYYSHIVCIDTQGKPKTLYIGESKKKYRCYSSFYNPLDNKQYFFISTSDSSFICRQNKNSGSLSIINQEINRDSLFKKYKKVVQEARILNNDSIINIVSVENLRIREEYLLINNQFFFNPSTKKSLEFSFKSSNYLMLRLLKSVLDIDYVYNGELNYSNYLFLLSKSHAEQIKLPYRVSGLGKDKGNNIYIASRYGQIYKLNRENIHTKTIHNPFSDKNNGLYLYKKILFIATEYGSLYSFNLENEQTHRIINTPLYEKRKPIFYKEDNKLVYSNLFQSYFLNGIIAQETKYETSTSDIKVILDDNLKYEIFKRAVKINKHSISNSNITISDACLFHHKVFLASLEGIYTLDTANNVIHKIKTNSLIDVLAFKQIIQDSTFIYLISNKIIFQYNPIKNKIVNSLRFQNPIKCVFLVEDKLGVACSNTYYIYDTSLQLILKNKIPHINSEDEIQACHYADSVLYVALNHQVLLMPYKDVMLPNNPVNILLKKITYNEVNLTYNRCTYVNNKKIKLKVDVFHAMDRNELKYQLICNQRILFESNLEENNQIEFYNLEPNEYLVQFKYMDHIVFHYTFTILPSIYQTWYFAFICFLCSSAFIIIIVRYFFILKQRILQREYLFLQLQSQARSNQLKSHFLFNLFVPLQNYILRNRNEDARNYLHKISDLLRNILNLNHNDFINMKDELTFIRNYLEIRKEEKMNKFSYELICNIENSNLEKLQIPILIIQPLIENAIDHGMSKNIEIEKKIRIIINKNHANNSLEISVFDNGNGFHELYSSFHKKTPHALQIIQNRLAILHKNKKNKYVHFVKHISEFEAKVQIKLEFI